MLTGTVEFGWLVLNKVDGPAACQTDRDWYFGVSPMEFVLCPATWDAVAPDVAAGQLTGMVYEVCPDGAVSKIEQISESL